ncbi:MAG: methyltransferase domain-containing protein [Anaerolineae bacterium]|nr:methyltransferase domain-containing protein [Anaerolineae bacterium]
MPRSLSHGARIDYDTVAAGYDSQPYRQKEVDAALLAYLERIPAHKWPLLRVLDISCGTGNQLVADKAAITGPSWVGSDLFYGMLAQAQAKDKNISWVQADACGMPFVCNSFDFISQQFGFHHIGPRSMMLREVYRLLRPGGCFVMTNIAPQEMRQALLYRYFPEALDVDLSDFVSPDTLVAMMKDAGFSAVELSLDRRVSQVDLQDFLKKVQPRDNNSTLMIISDMAYADGVARMKRDIGRGVGLHVPTETCILTLSGEKND